jgi:hypothetical protein
VIEGAALHLEAQNLKFGKSLRVHDLGPNAELDVYRELPADMKTGSFTSNIGCNRRSTLGIQSP